MTEKVQQVNGRKKNPITSIHPVVRQLMEIADEKGYTLTKLSRETGIPYNTLSFLRHPKITENRSYGATIKLGHLDMLALVLDKKIGVVERNDSTANR